MPGYFILLGQENPTKKLTIYSFPVTVKHMEYLMIRVIELSPLIMAITLVFLALSTIKFVNPVTAEISRAECVCGIILGGISLGAAAICMFFNKKYSAHGFHFILFNLPLLDFYIRCCVAIGVRKKQQEKEKRVR